MILKQIITLVLISLVASISYANDVFTNPTVGFSIEKPDEWVYLTTQTITENRKNVRLNDEELQKSIQKYATAPLVVMARHPEPYDELNPSIQVTFRPLGQLQGTPPENILSLIVPTIQRAVSDFEYIEGVTATRVSGLDAATMRARYTVYNQQGRTFETLTRMWLVPRGAYLFIIAMSGKANGPEVSETEFMKAFNSIKIEH